MGSWFEQVGGELPKRFRFGEIELALRKIHHLPTAAAPSFRARLRNLKRAGLDLGGSKPGRRANLTTGDALVMALAVELGQLGNSPERTVFLLRYSAEGVATAVQAALSGAEDTLLLYSPKAWSTSDGYSPPVGALSSFPLGKLAEDAGAWLLRMSSHERRLAVINFSAVFEKLVENLAPHSSEPLLPDLQEWAAELRKWAIENPPDWPTILKDWNF